MKKLLFLLLCFSLQVSAERVEPYSGSRIFWDASTRKVIFENGNYARVIKLQDGRLLAVTGSNSGDIMGSYSSDGGASWGDSFAIATVRDRIRMCVPDLIQLADGTIIVAYNPRPQAPYTEDRLFGIRCKRSTDNGATWSNEIFVNDATHDFYNGCWEPSMLQLPSGEVQLYFADEEPYPSVRYGEQQISMCRSFDGGKTWSKKQKVSYREECRDGMPVPILLADGTEIVVAIEDNGWGYGDFFPTTVRCSLAKNWGDGYFIDGDSPDRERTLDFKYCPVVAGGAPYLRKLGDDETILSWQSAYESNDVRKMWVAVGNAEARQFKALSKPFYTAAEEAVEWNSVAYIDSVVFALGSVGRNIEMEIGYAMNHFNAAYGTPIVDGVVAQSEGYYTSDASQVHLGASIGTNTTCDFAYDADNLYFITYVSDGSKMPTGAYKDCVYLYVDVANTSDTKPAIGTYGYMFDLLDNVTFYVGNGSRWRIQQPSGVRHVIVSDDDHYVIEAAISWRSMGLAGPPSNPLAVAIEVVNGGTSSRATDKIADADPDAPYTWIPLHLQRAE